jgi:hypothetical protein
MDLQVVPVGRIIDAAPKPRMPMFSQRSLLGQGRAQRLCGDPAGGRAAVDQAPLADPLPE